MAEQSGIDSEKFSKGMLTFNKRLGKLKGGFGPLYTALKKTNPQLARQLKAAENSAQAMDIMVRAMQDAKGADMKSMLADAAFGLTKMSLVGMKSADAIAALRGEQRLMDLRRRPLTADQAHEVTVNQDGAGRVSADAAPDDDTDEDDVEDRGDNERPSEEADRRSEPRRSPVDDFGVFH